MNIGYRLIVASVLLPLSLFAATITGTATSGGTGPSVPLPGVQVVLYGTNQQGLDTVLTDAQGKYTFSNVSLGIKFLTASKAGYQNGFGNANVTNVTGTYTVNFTMTASGSGGAMGRVIGVVRNARNQQPIANALVVIGRFGGPGGGYADSTRTNTQGQYSLDSVPAANNYTLSASASGYQSATATANVTANQTDTVNFNLAPAPSSLAGPGATFRTGGRLALDIGFSDRDRRVEFFSWNGTLRHTARVPAGQSQVRLPAGRSREDLVLRLTAE